MNNNKRWIGVVAAVVLAAVGTLILIQYVNSADQRALAGQETIQVYVLQQEVAAGTPAEELAQTVETILVPAATQVPGTVASFDEIAGTVAAVDLVPGEQLLLSRFIQPEVFLAATLHAAMGKARPIDIAEVTIGAALHKAHGNNIKLLDLSAGLLPRPLVITQTLFMDERPGAIAPTGFIHVGREGLFRLRDEPQREFR